MAATIPEAPIRSPEKKTIFREYVQNSFAKK